MSFKPSSPSTDITNIDPFERVAYSDIIEGSVYSEKEMEKTPATYHNKRCPVSLDVFQERYIHAFNRFPSLEDFIFQNELIHEKLAADGLPPRPTTPLAMVQEVVPAEGEPSPTLGLPATPPSFALKSNCPKIQSKRAKFKLQSSINPGLSKEKKLKELLEEKIKNIQDIRTQKLPVSPLQAGQIASELAQDLLELATFQACLQEEYKYMLELSLSASGSN